MVKKMSKRCYSDLLKLSSFDERYNYLKITSGVGYKTFGEARYLNQALYSSEKWRKIRRAVILRDKGCDLGIEGYEIMGNRIIVHHMNPITEEDILSENPFLYDPEFLICASFDTHNGIHFGRKYVPYRSLIERKPGDTKLW